LFLYIFAIGQPIAVNQTLEAKMLFNLLIVVDSLAADAQGLGHASLGNAQFYALRDKELSGYLVTQVRRLDQVVTAIESGLTLEPVFER